MELKPKSGLAVFGFILLLPPTTGSQNVHIFFVSPREIRQIDVRVCSRCSLCEKLPKCFNVGVLGPFL